MPLSSYGAKGRGFEYPRRLSLLKNVSIRGEEDEEERRRRRRTRTCKTRRSGQTAKHTNQEWLREKGFRFVSRERLNGERRLDKGLTWCEKYKIVIDVTM